MIDNKLPDIFCCPDCHDALKSGDNIFRCLGCQKEYKIIDGIPIFLSAGKKESDTDLALEKWHFFYKNFDWEKEKEKYGPLNLPYIYKHIAPLKRGDIFLELGAGPSFLSFDIAKNGAMVVCVDFDLDVLKIAKEHFQNHKIDGIFVCADINKLPFKEGIFDFSVGVGVIEHSRRILDSISEIKRVTKTGGGTFQTVPCLSLTTLTLNQRYGTIPHLPVIKDIFSFVNINILRAKHMKYGYEESFTLGFLENAFLKAGFRNMDSGFYDYNQTILKKNKVLGRVFYKLLRLKLFWDIIFIKAYK